MDTNQEITAQLIKHRNSVFAFILSIVRDFHLAEDIFQDTCVIISAKADQFRPGTNFLAWARAIAHREIKNAPKSRKYKKWEHVLEATETEAVVQLWEEREESPHMDDRKEALHACLSRLKSRAFKAFRWFYEGRYDCKQIASEFNTSVPAIHMLLKRTREKLATCVQRKLSAA